MPNSGEIAILYVPCGSEEEAVRIATTLIREALIACANIVASRSLYLWQDGLADETEHILLCKTAREAVEPARARIEQLHSYDLPCIIAVEPASVNSDYARWVLGQLSVRPGLVAQGANRTHGEVRG
ncbi:MAG: divalent-cation tolerance protein CutA [Chloroflexia bacterium]